MPTQTLSGQAAVSQDGSGTITFSFMQITNVSNSVKASDFTVLVTQTDEQLSVVYTYNAGTAIPSEEPRHTLTLNPPAAWTLSAEVQLTSVTLTIANNEGVTILPGTIDLVCNLNIGIAIFQSASNASQYFYCVLIDLPSDTTKYPDPSDKTGTYDSTTQTITYKLGYDLPPINTSQPTTTTTYMLQPFASTADPNSVVTVAIEGKAGTTPVKGSATGIRSSSLPFGPGDGSAVINTYQCRTFVIQSATNTSTYFVGALVDFPATEYPGSLQVVNSNELKADIYTNTSTTTTTYLVGPKVSSYNGTSNPPTATYIAIFIAGHNATGYKGVMLLPSHNINQYAVAKQINPLIGML